MLKIDLLPRQFAIARANKKVLVIVAVVLVGALVACFMYLGKLTMERGSVQAELEEMTPKAEIVRQLKLKTQSKQSDLQPFKDKLQFIAQADRSGSAFWDRFHEINGYIWERAQITDFSITPPGSVQFTAILHGTEEVGRFLLNLLRCDALTNINISPPPAGKSVEGAEGTSAAMGMRVPGPPGRPGATRPGMSRPDIGRLREPMGPRGMPGLPGSTMMTTEFAEPGSPEEEIIVQVTANLKEPINIPEPPGMAVTGAPGMGMPGMGQVSAAERAEMERRVRGGAAPPPDVGREPSGRPLPSGPPEREMR